MSIIFRARIYNTIRNSTCGKSKFQTACQRCDVMTVDIANFAAYKSTLLQSVSLAASNNQTYISKIHRSFSYLLSRWNHLPKSMHKFSPLKSKYKSVWLQAIAMKPHPHERFLFPVEIMKGVLDLMQQKWLQCNLLITCKRY